MTDSIGSNEGELIIHLSASTALASGAQSTRKELVSTVEQAIRLGATGISTHVNLGSDFEADQLKDMGLVAENVIDGNAIISDDVRSRWIKRA